jgi:hypothetical protein
MDRLLSFDANGDSRIAPEELPERMATLVSRGDSDRDGFLTGNELVLLVDTAAATPGHIASILRGSGTTLADVVADLKLPAATHNEAMAIVKVVGNFSDPTRSDLYPKMRELLNDEDYENFVAAAARLRFSPRNFIGGVGGVRNVVIQ